MVRPLLLTSLAIASLWAWAATSLANEQPGNQPALPDYMRYAEDGRSTRLEIAVRSFRMPTGQQVELIGVVHIADDA